MPQKPFTLEEFHGIYSKVPRLTVEVVVKNEKGVLLTLRKIKPYQGLWHIPGGTVYFKESLHDAIQRVANEELEIDVMIGDYLGYIEYMHEEEGWLDHAIGHAFLCTTQEENFSVEAQATQFQFFQTLPKNIVVEQKEFLEKVFDF